MGGQTRVGGNARGGGRRRPTPPLALALHDVCTFVSSPVMRSCPCHLLPMSNRYTTMWYFYGSAAFRPIARHPHKGRLGTAPCTIVMRGVALLRRDRYGRDGARATSADTAGNFVAYVLAPCPVCIWTSCVCTNGMLSCLGLENIRKFSYSASRFGSTYQIPWGFSEHFLTSKRKGKQWF